MTGACLTVSQVQSIPWAAAPSSASLLLVTSVCHADCHEGECRKALYEVGCSSGKSARLFPGKETGAGWRSEMAKRIGCCKTAG